MQQDSSVLAILAGEQDQPLGSQLAQLLGYPFAHIVVGTGHDAARYLSEHSITPKYILFVIGSRQDSVIEELEALASECVAGTKVVVAGTTNEIQFYRRLMDAGVLEYFPLPLDLGEVARALTRDGELAARDSTSVISFCGAASGDGASTIALNVAYALSKKEQAKTVIVDFDYQFGMIAKNLDLSTPYGIGELLNHPEREIDITLARRMVTTYDDYLDVIGAPNQLQFYPVIQPELVRDLLMVLSQEYRYVILDLPSLWAPWLAAAYDRSDGIYIIGQLWLKSVTHASRRLHAYRAIGVDKDKIHLCINRSGSKFKEAITQRDFERVCQKHVEAFFSNDIRAVASAEQEGRTIFEQGKTKLTKEIEMLAEHIKQVKQ